MGIHLHMSSLLKIRSLYIIQHIQTLLSQQKYQQDMLLHMLSFTCLQITLFHIYDIISYLYLQKIHLDK